MIRYCKRKGTKMKLKKNNFTPGFKAKVGCEALRENKTTNEIASEKGVHPRQIQQWKKTIIEESSTLFEHKNSKNKSQNVDVAELQRIVGEQTIRLEWYKKKLGIAN